MARFALRVDQLDSLLIIDELPYAVRRDDQVRVLLTGGPDVISAILPYDLGDYSI